MRSMKRGICPIAALNVTTVVRLVGELVAIFDSVPREVLSMATRTLLNILIVHRTPHYLMVWIDVWNTTVCAVVWNASL